MHPKKGYSQAVKRSHDTQPKKLLSLHPLTPEQALRAALQVKLEDVKKIEKRNKTKR